ncbi:GntR family transcriptional regulator [Saxibacter everestensis]|uniref:GntR family transcriptional regulator n=1 Tax=Saxibacter everestensis TaxID=2909229 RepID=A0ABY8QT14_9MICO|nr:GntR family transcriptional regulator [Brevibacteriaceae bacterium ZFBP1038]
MSKEVTARSARLPLARRSLSDSVHDAILAMLMDRQLQPGETLSIDGMARLLGVSPTPVREALARLEAPGLVRRTALKGYRVAPLLNSDEMQDLIEARLVLEPVLAHKACARKTPEFARELERSMKDQHKAGRGPSFESFQDFLRADEAFHATIARQSGNDFLRAAYEALGGQVQRFRLFAGQGVIDAEQAVAEHQAIHDALIADDPEQAKKAMTVHLENVLARAIAELAEIEK